MSRGWRCRSPASFEFSFENAREKNVKDEKLRDGWAARMKMEIINKNV